ncbi:MAG: type II secretion system F family protein [Candidatus Aenigmatarchaeota archaeon]
MRKVPPEERAVHAHVHEVVSAEYKKFREEELLGRMPLTLYEKLCQAAASVLKISVDPKTGKRLQEAIDFAHLRITPGQVASLTLLFTIAICMPTFLLLLLGNLGIVSFDLSLALFIFMTAMAIGYYIYLYPLHLRKRYEMAAGSEMVSAILYMVVHMRNVPALEGAVDFAARNMTGPMSAELRKLMWDVRLGNYLSMEDALLDYASRWKNNREFAEAIELMISSLKQTGPRATALLDEAVRVILDGNRESAAAYVRNLKMPITVIHAMGLILPVMGLVLFPIIAIFLSVSAMPLFLMYDVMLPLALFFMISRALESRPATYSKIDISLHPDLPPAGCFFWGKRAVRALPVAAMILAIFVALGFAAYHAGIACPEGKPCYEDETRGLLVSQGRAMISWSVLGALLATVGLAAGPAAYYLLLSKGRAKLREAIRKIEVEFKEALFQLGTALGGGAPIETAMVDALRRMEGLKIKDLFQRAAFNMQRFAMTFEQAFFDAKQGALIFYPSLLIRSVVRAVIEASRKGVRNASSAMIAISQYLRGVHATQTQVQEALSDVTSSLRFQAYALTPLISGVVSTMAVMIIRILQELAAKTAALGPGAGFAGISPLTAANLAITPFQFIIVVSIFVVESLLLLSYLMSGIESGEDAIGRGELTGWVLVVGTTAYILTTVITLAIFSPLAVAAV